MNQPNQPGQPPASEKVQSLLTQQMQCRAAIGDLMLQLEQQKERLTFLTSSLEGVNLGGELSEQRIAEAAAQAEAEERRAAAEAAAAAEAETPAAPVATIPTE